MGSDLLCHEMSLSPRGRDKRLKMNESERDELNELNGRCAGHSLIGSKEKRLLCGLFFGVKELRRVIDAVSHEKRSPISYDSFIISGMECEFQTVYAEAFTSEEYHQVLGACECFGLKARRCTPCDCRSTSTVLVLLLS